MEVRIPMTLVIEADSLGEAAGLVAPMVEDINDYLPGDDHVETKTAIPAGGCG